MKKVAIWIIALCILASVFASCSAPPSPAKPGAAELYTSSVDNTVIPGYVVEIDEKTPINALEAKADDSYKPGDTKTLSFDGKEYQAVYSLSLKRSMGLSYRDAYVCKDAETGNIIDFYFSRSKEEKLVGYGVDTLGSNVPDGKAKTEAELIEIAKTELGRFTDVDYYAKTRVEFREPYTYTVFFYNTVGDIEVADFSHVVLLSDGTVSTVIACPEPELLEVARSYELSAADFDAVLEERIKKAFVDYHCDNEEMLVDAKYTGMEVTARRITLDDEGNPIVAYVVRPQISYEYTYRGKLAELAEQRGTPVSENGTYSPPIFAFVEIDKD
ncbi:MAG: hypothetical protein ACI3XI_04880 [Eubacteriales bacterium]